MTGPVRYTITDELWESFTIEQVNKQIARLRETGRFRPPNNGGPFTVRLSSYACIGDPKRFVQSGEAIRNHSESQVFADFHFGNDSDEDWFTWVHRTRRPGSLRWTPEERRAVEHSTYDEAADMERRRFGVGRLPHEIIKAIWWERDFACLRVRPAPAETDKTWATIAKMAAHATTILLQDRRAHKIEIEPSAKPKLRTNFLKRRPDIPGVEQLSELALTIPRRVYTGEHGGTHASPRMHYRAEHVRQQPYGPRSAPQYREIVIEGTWINADDVDPSERGTPITRTYRFKAIA